LLDLTSQSSVHEHHPRVPALRHDRAQPELLARPPLGIEEIAPTERRDLADA
jgi:hypothetical protein